MNIELNSKMTPLPDDNESDEIFMGPITQRELIITWRIRRREKIERERQTALNNIEAESVESVDLHSTKAIITPDEEYGSDCSIHSETQQNQRSNNNSLEGGDVESSLENYESLQKNELSRISNVPDEKVDDKENNTTDVSHHMETSLKQEPTSKPFVLRPATLNVDSASSSADWVKRLNMKIISKPKRPAYVQPLNLT